MRRLLYIPILHSALDMGSAATGLAEQSAAFAGADRWALHQRTVRLFWGKIKDFLGSLDASCMKVYQDGLAAGGEVGYRIVEEAARRGSPNYLLVLELLQRGAELRKTEDLVLLLQERENLLRTMQQASPGEGERAAERYLRERDRLMEQRDAFIAATINETLQGGELGVLFLGAQHNVALRLADDITVCLVRDPERLRTYFEEIFAVHDDRRIQELAAYLTSPVSIRP